MIVLACYRSVTNASDYCPFSAFYKHFYFEGQEGAWRNQQGNRKKQEESERQSGGTGIGRERICFILPVSPARSLSLLIAGRAAGDSGGVERYLDRTGARSGNRTRSAARELLQIAGERGRCGRRPWFEGVLSFRAVALPMPNDAVDNAGICNKGDDAHAAAART
jgi:hypothetical protein